MKTLLWAIAIAILISGLGATLDANAKEIAELQNKGGGKMVITDELCNDSRYHLAFSVMEGVSTLFGCWLSDEQYVHIRWYDGDFRSYPMSQWRTPAKKVNI